MQALLFLALGLSVFTISHGAIDRQKALNLLIQCKQETGATEDEVKIADEQVIPSTPEGKCMMACLLREKGLMKGDRIDGLAVIEFFQRIYAEDEAQMEQAARAIANCATLDMKGLDRCEVAAKYMHCGQENNIILTVN